MSSNVLDFSSVSPRFKREYSKGGCRECKRRKIKCDEAKPACWQCSRLSKPCSYPESGEKVPRMSRKRMMMKKQEEKRKQNEEEVLQSPSISPMNVHNANPMSAHANPMGIHNPNPVNAQNSSPMGSSMSSTNAGPVSVSMVMNPVNPHGSSSHMSPMNIGPSMYSLDPMKASPMNIHIHGNSAPIPSMSHIPLAGTPPYARMPHSFGYYSPYSENQSPPTHSPYRQYEKRDERERRDERDRIDLDGPEDRSGDRGGDRGRDYNEALLSLFSQDDLNVLASDLNNIVTNIMDSSNYNSSASEIKVDRENRRSEYRMTKTNPMSNEASKRMDNGTEVVVKAEGLETDGKIDSSPINDMTGRDSKFGISGADKTTSAFGASGTDKSANALGSCSMCSACSISGTGSVCSACSVCSVPSAFPGLTPAEQNYLSSFSHRFSELILPFPSYDARTRAYGNPARDVILQCAQSEQFLLSAVLAHGAKASFDSTGSPEDEQAYCWYLNRCLELLGKALSTADKKLSSNIEAVLITVLLLTMANAANVRQAWREHLKGAKDLLLKVSASKLRQSRVLIFCKCWFVTFEILAGLSSKYGGTLCTEAEINRLVDSGDEYEVRVLREMGIILDNGFTVMGGYHYEAIPLFRRLLVVLQRIREDTKYTPADLEYIALLTDFYRLGQMHFVHRACVVSPAAFPNSQIPHGHLVDTVPVKDDRVVISWMDTSHQGYILGAILTILTVCMRETSSSPQVAVLAERIVGMMGFLAHTGDEPPRQTIRSALMMIQWPMLVAGRHCSKEKDRFVLEQFFKASEVAGSASAGLTMRRLRVIWDGGEEDECDVLSY